MIDESLIDILTKYQLVKCKYQDQIKNVESKQCSNLPMINYLMRLYIRHCQIFPVIHITIVTVFSAQASQVKTRILNLINNHQDPRNRMGISSMPMGI